MAKSLTQPELKQYNTNGLLDDALRLKATPKFSAGLIVFAHPTVYNRFEYRKVSKTQIGVFLPSVDWVHLCKPASLGIDTPVA